MHKPGSLSALLCVDVAHGCVSDRACDVCLKMMTRLCWETSGVSVGLDLCPFPCRDLCLGGNVDEPHGNDVDDHWWAIDADGETSCNGVPEKCHVRVDRNAVLSPRCYKIFVNIGIIIIFLKDSVFQILNSRKILLF